MLMVAGRLGVLGLALGSSLLLGVVPRVTADEVAETRSLDVNRASSAPSESGGASPQSGDAGQTPANASHRRRAAQANTGARSSRRPHGPSATVTELPVERIRQRAGGYDFNVPGGLVTDRSTLTQVIRRLAGWTDACPFCGGNCPVFGQMPADQHQDLAEAVLPPKSSPDRQMLGRSVGEESPDAAHCRPLRAGEPAQVILDTQKRLGKSVLDGTEFGGSPELLIQWIRALDEESRRQQAMLEEVSRADVEEVEQDVLGVSGPSQIEALRSACRQLQEAADLLEEQNLFESADSVREVADALREQSREKVGQRQTLRPGRRSDERAEDRQDETCDDGHCEVDP